MARLCAHLTRRLHPGADTREEVTSVDTTLGHTFCDARVCLPGVLVLDPEQPAEHLDSELTEAGWGGEGWEGGTGVTREVGRVTLVGGDEERENSLIVATELLGMLRGEIGTHVEGWAWEGHAAAHRGQKVGPGECSNLNHRFICLLGCLLAKVDRGVGVDEEVTLGKVVAMLALRDTDNIGSEKRAGALSEALGQDIMPIRQRYYFGPLLN